LGLAEHVALTQALKSSAADPLGAISTAIGYLLMPYYKAKLENADSAKWHTADSSKAIDYEQLKAKF
jgi:hypothetical protein